MPIYAYRCDACGRTGDKIVPIAERDSQHCKCPKKKGKLARLLAAPLGRIAGQVVEGGGPDRFTADMLGIPLKELPSGLKTKV